MAATVQRESEFITPAYDLVLITLAVACSASAVVMSIFACVCCFRQMQRRRNNSSGHSFISRRDTMPLEDLLSKPTLADPESVFSEVDLDARIAVQTRVALENSSGRFVESPTSGVIESSSMASEEREWGDDSHRTGIKEPLLVTTTESSKEVRVNDVDEEITRSSCGQTRTSLIEKVRENKIVVQPEAVDVQPKSPRPWSNSVLSKTGKKSHHKAESRKKLSVDLRPESERISGDSDSYSYSSSARGSVCHDLVASAHIYRLPKTSLPCNELLAEDDSSKLRKLEHREASRTQNILVSTATKLGKVSQEQDITSCLDPAFRGKRTRSSLPFNSTQEGFGGHSDSKGSAIQRDCGERRSEKRVKRLSLNLQIDVHFGEKEGASPTFDDVHYVYSPLQERTTQKEASSNNEEKNPQNVIQVSRNDVLCQSTEQDFKERLIQQSFAAKSAPVQNKNIFDEECTQQLKDDSTSAVSDSCCDHHVKVSQNNEDSFGSEAIYLVETTDCNSENHEQNDKPDCTILSKNVLNNSCDSEGTRSHVSTKVIYQSYTVNDVTLDGTPGNSLTSKKQNITSIREEKVDNKQQALCSAESRNLTGNEDFSMGRANAELLPEKEESDFFLLEETCTRSSETDEENDKLITPNNEDLQMRLLNSGHGKNLEIDKTQDNRGDSTLDERSNANELQQEQDSLIETVKAYIQIHVLKQALERFSRLSEKEVEDGKNGQAECKAVFGQKNPIEAEANVQASCDVAHEGSGSLDKEITNSEVEAEGKVEARVNKEQLVEITTPLVNVPGSNKEEHGFKNEIKDLSEQDLEEGQKYVRMKRVQQGSKRKRIATYVPMESLKTDQPRTDALLQEKEAVAPVTSQIQKENVSDKSEATIDAYTNSPDAAQSIDNKEVSGLETGGASQVTHDVLVTSESANPSLSPLSNLDGNVKETSAVQGNLKSPQQSAIENESPISTKRFETSSLRKHQKHKHKPVLTKSHSSSETITSPGTERAPLPDLSLSQYNTGTEIPTFTLTTSEHELTAHKTETYIDISDESDYDNPWDDADEAVKRASMKYSRRASRMAAGDTRALMLKSAEDLGRLMEKAEQRRRERLGASEGENLNTKTVPFTRFSQHRHTVKGIVNSSKHQSTGDVNACSPRTSPKLSLFKPSNKSGIDAKRPASLSARARSKVSSPDMKIKRAYIE